MSDMLRIEDGGREVWVAHGAAPAGRLHFVNGAAGLTLDASSGARRDAARAVRGYPTEDVDGRRDRRRSGIRG